MSWLERWLIPEWQKAHRLWSVQIAVANAGLSALWLLVPALQNYLDVHTYIKLCMVMALATLLVRLIKQIKLHKQPEDGL